MEGEDVARSRRSLWSRLSMFYIGVKNGEFIS